MYQRIQDLCHKNGTTITALCKKITGSSGNLSTWRKGNIRPEWISAISDEFKVSVDYLFGNDSESESAKLYALYSRLTPEQQSLVENTMRQLAESRPNQ